MYSLEAYLTALNQILYCGVDDRIFQDFFGGVKYLEKKLKKLDLLLLNGKSKGFFGWLRTFILVVAFKLVFVTTLTAKKTLG